MDTDHHPNRDCDDKYMDFNMNSFFSEGLLRDYGGRFLWESVPFHMEEPFMRLATDAGRQIRLSIFSGSSIRRPEGLRTGACVGQLSPSTPNSNYFLRDRALCGKAAMLEQKRLFLQLLPQSWEHERA